MNLWICPSLVIILVSCMCFWFIELNQKPQLLCNLIIRLIAGYSIIEFDVLVCMVVMTKYHANRGLNWFRFVVVDALKKNLILSMMQNPCRFNTQLGEVFIIVIGLTVLRGGRSYQQWTVLATSFVICSVYIYNKRLL